jgi:hypothetical protein
MSFLQCGTAARALFLRGHSSPEFGKHVHMGPNTDIDHVQSQASSPGGYAAVNKRGLHAPPSW